MKKRVTVVGPVNADIMVIGNYQGDWRNNFEWECAADISLCVAGSSGYTLQDFAILGNETKIFSSIGDDGIGIGLKDQMEKLGIDTTCLNVHKGHKTAIAVYWLMHGNKKRPFAYELSRFTPWPAEWAEETEEFLLDTDLLHCGGYLHYSSMYFGNTARLYKKARERGIVTSVDTQFPLSPGGTKTPWILNMTDILPYVDVLIADENETRKLTGEEDIDSAIEKLFEYPIKVLVVKFGAKGSRIFSGNREYIQAAIDVGPMVDSIGAGDAYGAAFLTYYIENRPLEECARFASTVAGFTVTQPGGVKGMPTREEAEDFIIKNL